MSKNSVKLKIAWLYPDILQSYSDEANVTAIYKRAQWRDINVELHKIKSDEVMLASQYDFYYIGGSDTNMLQVAKKCLKKNAAVINIAAESFIPMLAVYCGYLLFSTSYQLNDETQARGLDILNVSAIEGEFRHYGSIKGECKFLNNQIIAGFENHSLVSYPSFDSEPFLTVKKGYGNNAKDKTEGSTNKNVIGTYIQSPILIQNPHLCDYLLAKALEVKYKDKVPLKPLIDDIEWYCYNYLVEAK